MEGGLRGLYSGGGWIGGWGYIDARVFCCVWRVGGACGSSVGEARGMVEGVVVRDGCAETRRRICRERSRDCIWD